MDLENPRFDQLAEVYGAKGFYVEHPSEVADAVQQALALDGPSVIEIPVAEYSPRRRRFRAPKFHRPTRRIDSEAVIVKVGSSISLPVPGCISALSFLLPNTLLLETTPGLEAAHLWTWILWRFVTPF